MSSRTSASNCLLLLLFVICLTQGQSDTKVFNLKEYGAVEGGNVDISTALLKAWGDACKWDGRSRLYISNGIYLVNPVILTGPCNGPIEFQNSGTLKAPFGISGDYWVEFRYLDKLTVNGGGSFDGHGPPQQGVSKLPTLLRFSFVTNSMVQKVKLMNSQSTHFHLFACNNTNINHITVTSPGDTHNTDGIKIGLSNDIRISDTSIASGDDCVALLTGSKNITVTRVTCGPGHGISIGSMGWSPNEQVDQILVRNCTLSGTTNGLRIKSKANGMPGLVSNIQYENIALYDVDNPIIFDQNYCPPKTCPQGNSGVQISDVKFINIHGTSKTNVAVNLQCSGSKPCRKIELRNIDITYQGQNMKTISNCSHASGQSFGVQVPKPCLT